MATLNTLRTKFGIVLSAVIAFALLAFIFSLKSEMGFSGNDPVVVTINGESVTYTEYQAKYEQIKNFNNVDDSNEQQTTALNNAAMQTFVTSKVLTPGFEKLGITVSEPERMAIIRGEIATQTFYSNFVDPSTGEYDIQGVTMFLTQAAGNPEAEAVWNYVNTLAREEREATKYMSLLSGGAYINSLEVKSGLEHSNKKFAGNWIGKNYSSLADSLFTVSKSEVSKYYEANKNRYKRTPTRSISYVAFDVVATADDKLAIENEAKEVGAAFSTSADVRSFIRENRYGTISQSFVQGGAFVADEATALEAGEQYGPVLNNNTWRMSRTVEKRMAPDTISVRLIALPYTSEALADSLVVALNGGADFATIAAENSVHQQSAQSGGDVGAVPYSAFSTDIADALMDVKEGAIVKIEVADMIQILQPYKVGKKVAHYKVASIEYPVVASQATINKAHADAGLFAVDAKGSKSKFDEAATAHSVSVKDGVLTQGEREVRGIDSSREIARWAYGAKVGALSEIFKVDDGYVVAMLTVIDDAKFSTLESVTPVITRTLRNKKKFEAIKAELSGSTLSEQAASLGDGKKDGAFEGVSFESYYINGLGVEPRVIGAISATEGVNVLSEPIEGNNGLYVFEVTAIDNSAEPLTSEAEKVRLQASAEAMVQQMALPALQQMAEIEDLRGLYF
ncbi:MAG: SurA N-terminal domain-containing protein [Rikenellaceae bacterium]